MPVYTVRSAVPAFFAAAVLAGCGASSGVNTSADPQSSTSTGTSPGASTDAGDAKASAKLGDAITLTGNTGQKVSVTAGKVVDPVKATDGYSTPASGSRYVAVQFVIANKGDGAYDDSPSNGAKVADADGQQFEAAIMVDKTSAGPSLPSQVKVAPGGKAQGYLTFELPKGSKVAAVQFSMDSGFGETGEWKV